jgi:hypothetical protein
VPYCVLCRMRRVTSPRYPNVLQREHFCPTDMLKQPDSLTDGYLPLQGAIKDVGTTSRKEESGGTTFRLLLADRVWRLNYGSCALANQSGSSIRSACFPSRSCSCASTFSNHAACFAATHLSADFGSWPIKNSSPQPSHLSVPISWKPVVFSLLLFFIANARIFRF